MAPAPRAQVEATPVQPYRFGLESVLTPRTGGRWELSGVDFPSEACAFGVDTWPASCSDTAPPAEKNVTGDDGYHSAVPFVVYAAKTCKSITPEAADAAVRRRLALGEPRAVEAAFWNGAMGNAPSLALDTLTVLPPATGIVAAVAALEEALGVFYDGVGVIHAPRVVAPYAAAHALLERDASVLRTPLGTMWAFGLGYDRVAGPAGETDAAAGETWMYASGAVARWRSEVTVNPPGYAALDLTTGNLTVIAERLVMLARDCDSVAVKVTLADPGGGGGGGF